MPSGSVKKYFQDKGFGFIAADDGSPDVFAHAGQFNGDAKSVTDGMRVTYEAVWDDRKGKSKAGSWGPADGSGGMAGGGGGMPGGCMGMPGGCSFGGCGGMPGGCGQGCGSFGCAGGGLGGCNYGAMLGGPGAYGMAPVAQLGQDRASPYGMQGAPMGQQAFSGCGCGQGGVSPCGQQSAPLGQACGGCCGGASPALPPGWEQSTDPSSGKTYYFNRATNETSWDSPAGAVASAPQPVVAPAEAQGGSLPEGWDQASDPSSGKTYYFNRGSGATSWERP